MIDLRSCLASLSLLLTFSTASGQEYSVEIIDQPPKADAVAPELAKQFAAKGYRVKRDSTRTVCEIGCGRNWKLRQISSRPMSDSIRFNPGQLIGLLHFSRRGSDFRDQSVSSGWYTLRFDLQPVDGNHIGTSPTRDFLLMVSAEHDEAGKDWGAEELQELSSEAAGSSHPAMVCLQVPVKDAAPLVRHNAEADWWILHVIGKGVTNGKAKDLPIDLVVAGHAAE